MLSKKIYIYIPSSQTKGTIKTQKTKDKTITGNNFLSVDISLVSMKP